MTQPLSKEDLLDGLLKHNYFPSQHDHKEELPPIFNTNKLNGEIATSLAKINQKKERKKSGYDAMSYARSRHPNVPRIMNVPHPVPYSKLCLIIANFWEDELREKCASKHSILAFEKQDDGRIVVQTYDHTDEDGERETRNPLVKFGRPYRVQTDIASFFPSVYSHSIPWALASHREAKKNRRNDDLWYNKLDACIRNCQRNETKGIAIGPATSAIIAEILLCRIDEILRDREFEFERYIDDYTCFAKSKDEADSFLTCLSQALQSFGLLLNFNKTSVIELPALDDPNWVNDIKLSLRFLEGRASQIIEESVDHCNNNEFGAIKQRDLKIIIDQALSISLQMKNPFPLKYTFSALLKRGFADDQASQYFEKAIIDYAYHFPILIPMINRALMLEGPSNRFRELKERMSKLLERAVRLGISDNIVWCLYFNIKANNSIDKRIAEAIINNNDPFCMAMLYVYSNKTGKGKKRLADWAKAVLGNYAKEEIDLYDLDRMWIVFYQFFFDGLAKDVISQHPDAEAFEILMSEGVSFVDHKHDDITTWLDNIWGDIIVPPNFTK